ncbi:uncharacterized protein LOC144168871 [Haemaphysalis longicornis]
MANPKAQATRARFTVEDDINLLKEICAENPFKDTKAWPVIVKNTEAGTNRIFTVRTIRNRSDLLLAQFVHEDRTNLKRSGTEEQYDEKYHLLQDTLDLAKEFGYQNKRSAVRKITVARLHQRSDTAAERIVPAKFCVFQLRLLSRTCFNSNKFLGPFEFELTKFDSTCSAVIALPGAVPKRCTDNILQSSSSSYTVVKKYS